MSEYGPEYFRERGISEKHYVMTLEWLNSLDLPKTAKVLDWGCGRGPHVHALNYHGVNATGLDPSKDAIANPIGLAQGHLHDFSWPTTHDYDLVLCLDVLEHLEEKDAINAIKACAYESKKWVLFSICMAGDPNFPLDKTHKLFRSRNWWAKQIERAGMRVLETPSNWSFAHQFILAEVQK